jgi:nitrate/nitrite transport system substrate-binding protein
MRLSPPLQFLQGNAEEAIKHLPFLHGELPNELKTLIESMKRLAVPKVGAVFEELGFIHLLTKDLWNGHPCCAFGTSTEFIQKNPNTFAALFRAVLTSAAMAREARNRELIAKVIAPQQYLNQPEAVIAQVLTGKFADGLGKVQNVPDRADFDPIPWQSMAVWMLSQMKRWGYVKGDVNYRQIAERVFLLTDACKQMAALDMKPPPANG